MSAGQSSTAPPQYERVGPFEIREEIGRGSFATVFKGYKLVQSSSGNATKLGDAVAIKAVTRKKLTRKLLDNLESEIRLLKGIKHKHVTELVDCLKTEQHIYLVMAFCPAGDLSGYLKKRGLVQGLPMTSASSFPHPKEGGLNATIVRSFLRQLSEALEFLRSQDIIHRDIKPQNLLLSPDPVSDSNPPLLQVADFGFARFLPQASMAETLCGSPLYMAPEILRYEKYDAKADLWSTGAVLYEMCVGRPPFRAQNHVELLKKIERGQDRIKFPDEQSLPQGATAQEEAKLQSAKQNPVGPDVKSLIRVLLKSNPMERLSFPDFFAQVAQVTGSACEDASPVAAQTGMETSQTAGVCKRERTPTPPTPASATATPSRTSTPSFPPKYLVGPSSANQPSSQAPPASLSTSPVFLPQQPPSRLPAGVMAKDYAAVKPAPPQPSRTASAPAQQVPLTGSSNPSSDPSGQGGDLMLSKEYVVVEKGTVEINALADELAARPPNLKRQSTRGFLSKPPLAPSTAPGANRPDPHDKPPSPVRQSPPSALSASPKPYATPAAVIPYPPAVDLHTPAPFALASGTPRQRTLSYPRSFSYSSPMELPLVSSSGKAVAKVFNMASLKLFGNPADGMLLRKQSSRRQTLPKYDLDPHESALISELEDLGQKAMVVLDYADSKLLQLLPPTPQTATAYTNTGSYFPQQQQPHATTANPFGSSNKTGPHRTPSASSLKRINEDEADCVAAIALVLYLKALGFLQMGIEKARAYWDSKVALSTIPAASPEFNEAVQWLRLRFNESHEKADFVKTKLGEHEAGVTESTPSAEKLIYERALELSRAAALNELMGESITDCETAYETALYMLYAILETSPRAECSSKDEDQATVDKFIASIQGRLTSLRRKLVSQ